MQTFRNDLNAFGPWAANVVAGDRVPNVPRHALTLNAGIGQEGWSINALANYQSELFNRGRRSGGSRSVLKPDRSTPWVVRFFSAEADVMRGVSAFATGRYYLFDNTVNCRRFARRPFVRVCPRIHSAVVLTGLF